MIKLRVLDTVPKQQYTRQDVRRMLDISEQQLRSWERGGLIPGTAIFSFSDLIALRTLRDLRHNHIPSKQIGRALESLKKKLSDIEHPLSELKIVSNGRRIHVQLAGQKMEALTGQMLLNFDTSELGSLKSFPAARGARPGERSREAEAWFQKGLALEETGAPIEETIEAYKKTVELNPSAAGAWVNLGTISYRRCRFGEAETYYRKAIEADPHYPLAYFNIGNLYDEKGDLERAQECYCEALRLNGGYADAHFNLALLSERRGDPLKAVHHWKAYLKLDGASSWAEVAKRQLERLRQATLIRSR